MIINRSLSATDKHCVLSVSDVLDVKAILLTACLNKNHPDHWRHKDFLTFLNIFKTYFDFTQHHHQTTHNIHDYNDTLYTFK